jgi:hypothetical protein
LPLNQFEVAGDLVQATERIREAAKFGGVLSCAARRALSSTSAHIECATRDGDPDAALGPGAKTIHARFQDLQVQILD